MIEVLIGDAREQLRRLPDASVHCCVTSPPYFGLRSYLRRDHPLKHLEMGLEMGLETTPDEFVAGMVGVFREVRRVLRDDGTFWLNIGDSYADSGRGGNGDKITGRGKNASMVRNRKQARSDGLKPKDLIGIPWMLAFALRADGWFLRQEIIWAKPNPMPESVTDRCTKAHESLFLLSKSARYHFNSDAIAEPASKGADGSVFHVGKTRDHLLGRAQSDRPQQRRAAQLATEAGLSQAHIDAIRSVGITDAGKAKVTQAGCGRNAPSVQALADEAKAALGGYYREFLISERRNRRSVWTVPTVPYREAHFATFPPALIEPCILAGCPVGGIVLDPFGGSGTTGMVAQRLGRRATLIELNDDYEPMAERRIHNGDIGLPLETAA